MEAYPFDIRTGEKHPVVLLYTYHSKDIAGNAHIIDVTEEFH